MATAWVAEADGSGFKDGQDATLFKTETTLFGVLPIAQTYRLMGPDGKFIAVYDETLGPDGLAEALKKQI